MNIDRAVLRFAGFVVLPGRALGWLVNPYWYLLTAFAGLNMIQSSFYRLLPRGNRFQEARHTWRQRIFVTRRSCTPR